MLFLLCYYQFIRVQYNRSHFQLFHCLVPKKPVSFSSLNESRCEPHDQHGTEGIVSKKDFNKVNYSATLLEEESDSGQCLLYVKQ